MLSSSIKLSGQKGHSIESTAFYFPILHLLENKEIGVFQNKKKSKK